LEAASASPAAAAPENRRGSTFQAVVRNPAKLAGFGFAGVKSNEKIVVTFLDEGGKRFSVVSGTEAKSRVFTISDKGAVKAVPVAAGAGKSPTPPPGKAVAGPLDAR
jgi:hypothetical protein